jgi:3-phenylpropionate/trans-cinnamate dioxygenase ferredoxin component
MGRIPTNNDNAFEFYSIGDANDLGIGERLFVEIGSRPIVVVNIEGKIFAIADVCSHDDGPLGDGEINDHIIKCPRHGATFDIKTGKVLSYPAIVDIPTYPVKIIDGDIRIGILKEK